MNSLIIKNKLGFSLVELLLINALFLIISLGIANVVILNAKSLAQNDSKNTLLNLESDVINYLGEFSSCVNSFASGTGNQDLELAEIANGNLPSKEIKFYDPISPGTVLLEKDKVHKNIKINNLEIIEALSMGQDVLDLESYLFKFRLRTESNKGVAFQDRIFTSNVSVDSNGEVQRCFIPGQVKTFPPGSFAVANASNPCNSEPTTINQTVINSRVEVDSYGHFLGQIKAYHGGGLGSDSTPGYPDTFHPMPITIDLDLNGDTVPCSLTTSETGAFLTCTYPPYRNGECNGRTLSPSGRWQQ